MKRVATFAMAALLAAMSAAPAFADPRDHHRSREWRGGDHRWRGDDHRWRRDDHHRDRDDNDAIAAGIVGLAIGAIIGSAASSSRYDDRSAYNGYAQPYYGYGQPSYGYGYAPQPYYQSYAPPPRLCVDRRRQWDPYIGRSVWVERSYPC